MWFGFVVRSAFCVLTVGMCAVLSFGVLPGLSCCLRVTKQCVGFLCLFYEGVVLDFFLVLLGLQYLLQLSSTGLIVVLIPGCCRAYAAFSV